jgi:hypothetical protein
VSVCETETVVRPLVEGPPVCGPPAEPESSYPRRLLYVPVRECEPKNNVRRTGRHEAIIAMAVSIMETVHVIICSLRWE